ncbi:MAG: DUF6497 family protein [Gemmobacter sp.]|nr:DUF6497 family protein [Gemmobacter sp.]
MRKGLLVGVLFAVTPVAAQDLIAVPSGQQVLLQDVVLTEPGPDGLTARFRFIAPQIARNSGTVDFETAAADMEFLCNTYALPRVSTVTGPTPQQIVISLSDIPVPFGEIMPEATQFFEAYSFEDNACIWEIF